MWCATEPPPQMARDSTHRQNHVGGFEGSLGEDWGGVWTKPGCVQGCEGNILKLTTHTKILSPLLSLDVHNPSTEIS